jgi:hypothetical protein
LRGFQQSARSIPLRSCRLVHHSKLVQLGRGLCTFSFLTLFHVPTAGSMTPCSPPSRRRLQAGELVASVSRRRALTASALGVFAPAPIGTCDKVKGKIRLGAEAAAKAIPGCLRPKICSIALTLSSCYPTAIIPLDGRSDHAAALPRADG